MKSKKNDHEMLLHGNEAQISKDKTVTPINLTNTIVPKQSQHNNNVPAPTKENIILSKQYVDENHK